MGNYLSASAAAKSKQATAAASSSSSSSSRNYPWHWFEIFLRAFLKFSGLDGLMKYFGGSSSSSSSPTTAKEKEKEEDESSGYSKTSTQQQDDPSTAEIESKASEDADGKNMLRSQIIITSRASTVTMKPPRKPVSSGRGGQINSTASS